MDLQTTLSLSKKAYQSQNLSSTGAPFDNLVVGAMIFHPKLLLLKRAAHETTYPNVFEIPGGKVEDTDATILDALKREVREETALSVVAVPAMLDPMYYVVEKQSKEGDDAMLIKKTCVQLNFVCEVSGERFQVDREEHSEGQWVGRSEFVGLEMTEEMAVVVKNAFDWKEAQKGGGKKDTAFL